MARLFKARLKDGGDAGAVQSRTGVRLWPSGEWKPLSEYNIGAARTEALFADPEVECELTGGEPPPELKPLVPDRPAKEGDDA